MGFWDKLDPISGALGAAGGIVGGILGYKEQKAARKQQAEYSNLQAALHNKYLAERGAGVQDIIGQLGARGQDIYGPQTTTRSGTSRSQTVTDEDIMPYITGEYAPLAGMQRAMVERRLTSPTGLPAGYEATGLQRINQAAEGARSAERNLARRRGVSADVLAIGSPAERSRRQQTAQFLTETPLKARELQTQDLGLAQQLIEAFGKAQKRKGTSTTVGSETGRTTGPADYGALASFLLPAGPQAATMRV